ncbi:MAG: RNA polymerase sigma factor [Planctomycetota bacterium]
MRLIPRVLSSLSKRGGPPLGSDALGEVSQEVFARVWAALPKFGGIASLETWVYRFCVLTLFDHRRGSRTESRQEFERIAADLVDESAVALSVHDAAILHGAMARLLPEEFEVVEARHFRAMTFDEAANALSVSQGTLKTRYYRAMSRLRVWLRRSFGEPGEPSRGADDK